MVQLDKTDRYIAAQLTHRLGVSVVGIGHELYLAAHKQRAGLTDTEYQYLMSVHDEIAKQQKRLSKLSNRLIHGKESNGR